MSRNIDQRTINRAYQHIAKQIPTEDFRVVADRQWQLDILTSSKMGRRVLKEAHREERRLKRELDNYYLSPRATMVSAPHPKKKSSAESE